MGNLDKRVSPEEIKALIDGLSGHLLQTAWLYLSCLSTENRSSEFHGIGNQVSEDFMEDYDKNRCPHCNRRI